jgi:hypothetical protein
MAQHLADLFGGRRETCEPVGSVGYLGGEINNVMNIFGESGDYMFDIAYRPHKPEAHVISYDEHGLFMC